MATSITYVYELLETLKREDFEQIIVDVCELFIKDREGGVTFIYDDYQKTIYPIKFMEPFSNTELLNQLSIKYVYDLLISGTKIIVFISRKLPYRGVYLKTIERDFDYPRMIADLETAKRVITMRTNNYLATDDRKFSFIDDVEKVYEVDCLGTMLCQDIADLVINEWNQFCKES